MTRYGLSATYLLLAATGVLILLSALFVVDRPPGAATAEPGKPAAPDTGMTSAELFRSGRFWALSIAFAAIATGASVRSAHIVPLAMGWGIDATRAAVLISVSSIGGMLGSPVWGWVAERLGGARVLAILCIIGALGWVALLLKPPFLLLALLSAAMGFASGAVVPVVSLALSQVFGQPSFGRAFGLANLVSLPYTVVGVPAAAVVFVQTGSYTGAMIGLAVFGLLGLFCALKLSGAPRLRAA
jgi:predicted MFS family arabinose efflux permease